MKEVLRQDILDFKNSFELADRLSGASFLITGATGLIGSILVRCLLSLDKCIKMTIPVRSYEKARIVFGDLVSQLEIIEGDLFELLSNIDGGYDYLIHCASPTAGQYMITHPIETYAFAIDSTRLLLDYARTHTIKSMVYVSSIEYYGQIYSDLLVDETVLGYVDPSSSRSCYPLAKRSAEYFCVAYAKEQGIPVKIARLTQTFGAGISATDNRVFAQFARSIIVGEDIILHTQGDSAKPYCYTIDSVSALLYILLEGKRGEAYNVANADTYISIRELAEYLCEHFNPTLKVRIELHPELGYAATTKLRLNTEKLRGLGWNSNYSLWEMFDRLIRSLS